MKNSRNIHIDAANATAEYQRVGRFALIPNTRPTRENRMPRITIGKSIDDMTREESKFDNPAQPMSVANDVTVIAIARSEKCSSSPQCTHRPKQAVIAAASGDPKMDHKIASPMISLPNLRRSIFRD
jgi:hypothetical protein